MPEALRRGDSVGVRSWSDMLSTYLIGTIIRHDDRPGRGRRRDRPDAPWSLRGRRPRTAACGRDAEEGPRTTGRGFHARMSGALPGTTPAGSFKTVGPAPR